MAGGHAAVALAVALAVTAVGCVDTFEGSFAVLRLGTGVHVPSDDDPGFGRPPARTHYEMWVVSDGAAGPALFHVFDFRVVPVIDQTSPCFIEVDDEAYRGVHVTRWYAAHEADLVPPAGVPSPDAVNRLADARERQDRLPALAATLKAVVAYDPTVTPAALDALAAQIAAEAPIDDFSAAKNARRYELCQAFFAAHPRYYVGSDLVFSLPVSGEIYGLAEGTVPGAMNNVGGAAFYVPYTFERFDRLWVTWQFDDPADPRRASFGPSDYGYFYMGGVPERRTRRTINVSLKNDVFPSIAGELAVIPRVDEDQAVF